MKPFFFAAAASVFALAACSPATEDGTPAVAPPPVEAPETPIDAPLADQAQPVEDLTLVDVAATNPDFSTLLAAIDAAGLSETLAGPGPYTVFAPTNEAFAALAPGELDTLLLPENKDKLTRIVGYHVIPGKVLAGDVPAEDAGVATASINNLDLSVRRLADGTVMVNQYTVATSDIQASNGVIHVIDGVLIPRMEE
ncbi:fasciclin domain-containing protein [Hyphomonas sp. CACIAM 19H1]|uniref:fasciclin domain-containing protein n=1 Tax=Hyphomonas sp. CACIAM 19H1 TaxID=1873716 RepID=UPI000DED6834|nr:fasciclin domain-containing protein [Hyphomonas sp. CACIAM 19H1]